MTMLEKSKKTGRVAQKRDHTNPNPRVRLAAVEKLEDPEQWTPAKIQSRAALIASDKGPEGDFDD